MTRKREESEMAGLDCGFIAVGFDGSAEGLAATRWALGRAAGMQAGVKIVHCWRRVGGDRDVRGAAGTRGAREARDAADARGGRGIRRARELRGSRVEAVRAVENEVAAARSLIPRPPAVAMVFAEGPVQSVLAAHSRGAAMLVLGASAPGVLGDPALGPVAGPCLRRVGCPIVVVDRHGRATTSDPRSPALGLAG